MTAGQPGSFAAPSAPVPAPASGLPVLPALRGLLPRGGLPRGSVVAVAEFGLLCLARGAAAAARRQPAVDRARRRARAAAGLLRAGGGGRTRGGGHDADALALAARRGRRRRRGRPGRPPVRRPPGPRRTRAAAGERVSG